MDVWKTIVSFCDGLFSGANRWFQVSGLFHFSRFSAPLSMLGQSIGIAENTPEVDGPQVKSSGGCLFGLSEASSSVCGCFLKWWYPKNTPKWSFLVGKPMVVGYHHFRKPPCIGSTEKRNLWKDRKFGWKESQKKHSMPPCAVLAGPLHPQNWCGWSALRMEWGKMCGIIAGG